ncbi:flagellar hook-length control protein FliK [Agaribacterium sp. ZY112]|uniref:flagellar hook-length control protein FliK n=1 Tax=Agaribacterium sp. ZY112 TaxID=3233574 RepID=UPI003525F229
MLIPPAQNSNAAQRSDNNTASALVGQRVRITEHIELNKQQLKQLLMQHPQAQQLAKQLSNTLKQQGLETSNKAGQTAATKTPQSGQTNTQSNIDNAIKNLENKNTVLLKLVAEHSVSAKEQSLWALLPKSTLPKSLQAQLQTAKLGKLEQQHFRLLEQNAGLKLAPLEQSLQNGQSIKGQQAAQLALTLSAGQHLGASSLLKSNLLNSATSTSSLANINQAYQKPNLSLGEAKELIKFALRQSLPNADSAVKLAPLLNRDIHAALAQGAKLTDAANLKQALNQSAIQLRQWLNQQPSLNLATNLTQTSGQSLKNKTFVSDLAQTLRQQFSHSGSTASSVNSSAQGTSTPSNLNSGLASTLNASSQLKTDSPLTGTLTTLATSSHSASSKDSDKLIELKQLLSSLSHLTNQIQSQLQQGQNINRLETALAQLFVLLMPTKTQQDRPTKDNDKQELLLKQLNQFSQLIGRSQARLDSQQLQSAQQQLDNNMQQHSELWLRLGGEQVPVKVSIKDEPNKQTDSKLSRSWQLDMEWQLAAAGRFSARLNYSEGRISSTLWAEQSQWREAIRQQLPRLAETLNNNGIEVAQLRCTEHEQQPKERASNLIDVRT